MIIARERIKASVSVEFSSLLVAMLSGIVLVVIIAGSGVIGGLQAGVNRDVDIFNKNYNRRNHNARDLVYRVYDVVQKPPEPTWKASATLTSDNAEQSVTGEINFKQWNVNSPVLIAINITGLPKGKHSVHIHAFGDVTDGCKSTGPHFRSSIIGNIETKDDEALEVTYESVGLNLFGLSGILGRSVVIHEKPAGKEVCTNQ